jgi:hypothetical protein
MQIQSGRMVPLSKEDKVFMLLANVGKAFACNSQRRKIKIEEGKAARAV